jgi:hypothetical protein
MRGCSRLARLRRRAADRKVAGADAGGFGSWFRADEIVAALRAAERYWRALANEDDHELIDVVTDDALEALRDRHGASEGLAGRMRVEMGFAAADAAGLLPDPFLAVLSRDALRIRFSFDVDLQYEAVGYASGPRIDVERDGERWRADPTRAPDRRVVGRIDATPYLDGSASG